MRKPLWILVPCLVLTGCASMLNLDSSGRDLDAVRFEQSWLGHPEAEIIAALGPPTRDVSDAKDGHILVWEFDRVSLPFCLGGCPRGTPNVHRLAERHAYIGPDGLVYKTYWSVL